jgi:hypothetical protein
MRTNPTHRETEGLKVQVRLDTGTPGAVYVKIRDGLKVSRTTVRQQWPLVAVDYAEDGRVIGVEAVGIESFTLQALFRIAGIRVSARAAQRAEFLTGVAA